MPETTGTTNSSKKSRATRSRKRASRKSSKGSKETSQGGQSDLPQLDASESGLPTDGKLYYRIGEVSRITGIKPYVLRYWESEFRWMAPQKSRSKQRLYRRKDIEMIQLIRRLLHEERYTIAGARKRLRELGVGRALEESRAEAQARSQAGAAVSKTDAGAMDVERLCREIKSELREIRELL
jgi:DNA-binding transcriptional MerR regulator